MSIGKHGYSNYKSSPHFLLYTLLLPNYAYFFSHNLSLFYASDYQVKLIFSCLWVNVCVCVYIHTYTYIIHICLLFSPFQILNCHVCVCVYKWKRRWALSCWYTELTDTYICRYLLIFKSYILTSFMCTNPFFFFL